MNIDGFWKIIETGCRASEPEKVVTAELEKLSPEEIISYQKHFDQLFQQAYKWDLWGAAYLIGGGCSDDAFIDFRYGLISKGRKIYEAALANPDSLAALGPDLEIENEMFGYIADEVYEDKTGEEMPCDEPVPFIRDNIGEEWDFDDLDECNKRLPALSKIYLCDFDDED